MLRVDKRVVDDVLRLYTLPQHRLLASLAVIERQPDQAASAIGRTLSCADEPQAVARFGCGDATESSRAELAEEGKFLFEDFLDEHADRISEMTCRAYASGKAGFSDDSVLAAVAVAVVSDVLEVPQGNERANLLSALVMSDTVLLQMCGEVSAEAVETVKREQLS